MSTRLEGLRLRPVDASAELTLHDDDARPADVPGGNDLKEATKRLRDRLEELQQLFHADGRYAVLLVLQGRDASGKDGTIRKVLGAVNPMGLRIFSFGKPTDEELSHDYLWRVHQRVPPRRMIGVFNRSHYEDVLVVRVRELVSKAEWSQRYEQINAFESMLAANKVVIRKCFLHVSRDEQHRRLHARLVDAHKNWKFRLEDLDDRARWDDYTAAYRDMLQKCSTPHAPWYVVPADDKPVRNYLIARMLVETLESLELRYPVIDEAVRRAAEAAHW